MMATNLGTNLARIAIVVALFALWEALSRLGIVNPRLLPSATDTLGTLDDLLKRTSVRNDLAATAGEVLYGPDVNGRPCSPPSTGTLDDAPGIEAVNGRPCQPPSGGTVHGSAAPPVADSAESTG